MCYPESRGVSSKQALLFMTKMRAGLQEFHRNSERKLLNSTFNRFFHQYFDAFAHGQCRTMFL